MCRADVPRAAAAGLAPARVPPPDAIAFAVLISRRAETFAYAQTTAGHEQLGIKLCLELARLLEGVGKGTGFHTCC